MSQQQDGKKGHSTKGCILVFLAWVFIGGQALLAAGNVYNYAGADGKDSKTAEAGKMPWQLAGQGATKMRLIAMQAKPEVVGDVAIFLAVANTLGLIALMCALLSWSRSKYQSGKLTIAAAIVVVVVNSLLNLPYA